MTMFAVPGHDSYVLYPYRRDFPASAAACREMGEQCEISVDVELRDTPDMRKAFWRCLRAETGGLPGQDDEWRTWNVWTQELNELGDMVGVSLRRESIGLYLRASRSKNPSGRAQRMLQYSRTIRNSMSDQQLDGNELSESKKRRSISVRRPWDRDDQDTWPQAAQWIKDQTDRLQAIAQANP